MRTSWLALVWWLSLGPVVGQGVLSDRVAFDHLTIDDGLSQEDVHVIHQDTLGFLWFGTEDGLNRYDGDAFRVFRPLAFDTTSLSSSWVVGVASAGPTALWVATNGGGLSRYEAEAEAFVPVALRGMAPLSEDLFTLLQARDGSLWIGTRYEGLIHFDPRTSRAVTFRSDPDAANGLGDDRITALLEDRKGHVWVGTAIGGLSRLDPATGTWTQYRRDRGERDGLPGDHVTALLEDRGGHVWVGSSPGGLSRYRPQTNDFVHYRHDPADPNSLGHPDVLSLLEDPAGALWIGMGDGLGRMDPATERFVHHRHAPAEPTSVRPGAVLSLHLDRSGVFWVGTDTGLSSFVWGRPPFRQIAADPDDPHSLDDPGVWSIYEDRAGLLWVGTATGLNRVDRAAGTVARFPIDDSDPYGLRGGSVHGIHEDRRGDFWVGTHDGMLHRFDRGTGRVAERFSTDPADATSLKSSTPWYFLEDSAGRFWITSGSRGCLNQMDPATRTFQHFCHDPADPDTPAYDIAHDLLEGRSGAFWLGTWGGGLDRFDPATGRFDNYRHDPTDVNSPASDFILALFEDAEGMLWLGHYGAGLDRFDPQTETFTHFSEANSDLPNDIVLAIEQGEDGDLWLSTYRGLARLTPATGRIRSYGVRDGLQALEFNSNASFRAPSGELFFGGVNGVTTFFPDRIVDNPVAPPVVLTALRVRGLPVEIGERSPLVRALPFTRSLTLRYDQHDLAVSFAALHFVDPARNRYRYRLEGYDEGWYSAGRERTATYTNLDPGTYAFHVQAANSDGVWNEEGATLALTILPPWWGTWWARLGYALLVFGSGAVLYRARTARREERHRREIERVEGETLRELDRARSRFFANVSHEFRTPLTLTIGPLDDLKAGLYGPLSAPMTGQVDLARRNAGRVLDLIEQILDVARLEAGRTPLRARPLDLSAFVAAIAQAFVPLAERKGIALDTQVPDVQVPDVQVPEAQPPEAQPEGRAGSEATVWADAEHLQKVFANLLSNALKFTPEGGAVRVTVDAETDDVRVTVRDSGPGIPAADLPYVFERFYRVDESAARMQPGTGIGLALVKELVDLHGGTIEVESEEGFGSLFRVAFQRGRDHLRPEDVVEDGEGQPLDGLSEDGLPALVVAHAPDEALVSDEARGDGALVGHGERADDEDETTVLVVDDSAEIRAYVRRHLAPEYRVVEAADGAEGLAKARTLLPDLVLSDVMMPGMDGFALCRALKADPETDFIPVVLLTARAEAEDRLEGLGVHADDYLTKPFDVRELWARVDNLIASRRRLRERFASGAAVTAWPGPDGGLHAAPVEVDSAETVFLEQVRCAVEAHLGDEDFTVERLAKAVGVSRGHLHRQLKALAGRTPTEAIRAMRLERGAQLLAARAGTVSEVAYAVGFKSVSHFSNSFEKDFGCRPSAYVPEG
jgi:signal transduction histidine kinase/ligand-binding sensor domain-containing protein/DNA-binding response OmpR family regulator